jgi:hypothetical protein
MPPSSLGRGGAHMRGARTLAPHTAPGHARTVPGGPRTHGTVPRGHACTHARSQAALEEHVRAPHGRQGTHVCAQGGAHTLASLSLGANLSGQRVFLGSPSKNPEIGKKKNLNFDFKFGFKSSSTPNGDQFLIKKHKNRGRFLFTRAPEKHSLPRFILMPSPSPLCFFILPLRL